MTKSTIPPLILKQQTIAKPWGKEVWLCVSMPDISSEVEGDWAEGRQLDDFILQYGAMLLGEHVVQRYGERMPLLVKTIIAKEPLSVQVHPNDSYAQSQELEWGKDEAWFVLDQQPSARLHAGWLKETSSTEVERSIRDGTILKLIQKYQPIQGDLFNVPAGTIHSLGPMCHVLEVQQASDTTYRLYDFGRKDAEGRARELHINDALASLRFTPQHAIKVNYNRELKNRWQLILETKHFALGHQMVAQTVDWDLSQRDSFTILYVVNGVGQINHNLGATELLPNSTVILPANLPFYQIKPKEGEELLLIDTYVPQL